MNATKRIERIALVAESDGGAASEDIVRCADSLADAFRQTRTVLAFRLRRGRGAVQVGERFDRILALRSAIRRFAPGAVIYLPSRLAGAGTLARAFYLRRVAPHARHGIAALRPAARANPAVLLRAAAPDMIWVSSYRSLLELRRRSAAATLLPPGVDPSRFRPPSGEEKAAARGAHRIGAGSFVFLHIGPPPEGRTVDALASLAGASDGTIVVAGGEGDARRPQRMTALDDASRETLYRVADCCILSASGDADSIGLPLCVLEALASGVPLLAAPFGALRDFLPDGEDVAYWRSPEELHRAADRMRAARPAVRGMDDFYWQRIAERMIDDLCGRTGPEERRGVPSS